MILYKDQLVLDPWLLCSNGATANAQKSLVKAAMS